MRSKCFLRKAANHQRVHALHDAGKSNKEIEAITGLGKVTVWKYLKTKEPEISARRKRSIENQKIAKEMKQAGVSYKEIGRHFGFSAASACELIRTEAPGMKEGICPVCKQQRNDLVPHHKNYITDETELVCRSCHVKTFHPEALNKLRAENADRRASEKLQILRFTGWKELQSLIGDNGRRTIVGIPPDSSKMIVSPNPLKDLNAIHEAEKRLNINQLSDYADELEKVCVPIHICPLTHWQAVVMASAEQRSKALLTIIARTNP